MTTANRQELQNLEDKVDNGFELVQKELAEMRRHFDGRIDSLDGRLAGLDGRIDGLDGRIDGLDGRIDGLEERLRGEMSEMEHRLIMEIRMGRQSDCQSADRRSPYPRVNATFEQVIEAPVRPVEPPLSCFTQ